MSSKVAPSHGGQRKGAGRKAIRGETVVKRIPKAYAQAVNTLIIALDEQRESTQNKLIEKSEWVYLPNNEDDDGSCFLKIETWRKEKT